MSRSSFPVSIDSCSVIELNNKVSIVGNKLHSSICSLLALLYKEELNLF